MSGDQQSPFNITSDKIPIQYQITLKALYIHKQVFAARYPPTNKALYLAIKSEDERLDPASTTTPFCHEAWRDLIRAGRNGRNRDKAVDWGKTWGQFFNKKTLNPTCCSRRPGESSTGAYPPTRKWQGGGNKRNHALCARLQPNT